MKLRPCLVAGLLASCAVPVTAVENLPEIVVTATRTPLSVTQVPAAATVLNRLDIERLQVKDLPAVLKTIPGVDLTESGGPGKFTSVFLRGTESDHVLVLVNGIRVGSASAGLTSFELLPLDQIDRIEVIRGPRASQWGSEAIGGVIQIFTRQGEGEPSASISAGGGTFDTYTMSGSIGGSMNDTHYQIDASYFDSAGFDTRQPVPGPFGLDQPDKDGFDNTSIHGRAGRRFENGMELDAFVWRALGSTEFDGSFQNKTDFVQQVIGGSASFTPSERWKLVLRVGENRDESENFAPDGSFASRFDTKRQEMSLQNDFSLSKKQILTLGGDLRREKIASSSGFTETSRDNTGLFAQYLAELGSHQVLAALRYDDNQAFGTDTTGGLGWNFRWPNGARVYASYGTAFKAPSFNELFFPEFGNPNLGSESSESYEFGFEGQQAWGEWGVHVYRTDIEDLIVTVSDPITGNFFPENVDTARIQGIEAEVSTELADWQFTATANAIDPQNRRTGKRLRRRAKHSMRFEVLRNYTHWLVGVRLLAQGDRFEDADNRIRLAGYGVVDLVGEYRLSQRISIRAKIGNLFDKQYQTVETFNSADRNIFISMHYKGR